VATPTPINSRSTDESYPCWLLYCGFFLNGLGVVLLGPLLPHMSHAWGLSDWQEGTLLAAQFLGSSLGSLFTSRHYHTMIAKGSMSSCLGIVTVALALTSGHRPPMMLVITSLLVYGFGLGQVMTSINLTLGRDAEGRVSRLSLGNALWSLGAILSPMLLTLLLQRVVAINSILFLVGGSFLSFTVLSKIVVVQRSNLELEDATTNMPHSSFPIRILLLFGAMFFLYGGAETCFSGWLTTFAHRSAGVPNTISSLYTSAFWFGVAGGRALANILLRGFYQRWEMYILCSGALICSLGLLGSGTMLSLSIVAACCGIFLGPIFPVAFSALLSMDPSPRQSGFVLTCCGVGASALPLVLGILSQRVASLRMALFLPSACLLIMLALASFWDRLNFPRPITSLQATIKSAPVVS